MIYVYLEHIINLIITNGILFYKVEGLTLCSTNPHPSFWQFSGHTRLFLASVPLLMLSFHVFNTVFACYSFLHLRSSSLKSLSLKYITLKFF